jgi:hypothetical protein
MALEYVLDSLCIKRASGLPAGARNREHEAWAHARPTRENRILHRSRKTGRAFALMRTRNRLRKPFFEPLHPIPSRTSNGARSDCALP